MCFSATASFTAAALLLPVGTIAAAASGGGHDRQDASFGVSPLPLALTPALFGVQQAVEGLVWLGVQGQIPPAPTEAAAQAYLFFAYGFWPVWIPFAALRFPPAPEATVGQRRILGWLPGLGFLLAAVLWLPLPFSDAVLTPQVVRGSLHYPTSVVFADPRLNDLGHLLYALIITLPLLLAARRGLAIFASALLLSFAVAQGVYPHAFSSVWCYFCALLSMLILGIVRAERGGSARAPSIDAPGGPA